jgi:putative hydrolase of the HAD superfamily
MTHPRAAVIFDLYGTLVDVHVDESSALVWDKIAGDFFGGHAGVSGAALKQSYVELCDLQSTHKDEGFLLDAVFTQLLRRFAGQSGPNAVAEFASIFRRYSIVYLNKKPYTDSLLQQIRASGYKIGLISNTEGLLTRYDLDILQLNAAFDQIILSSFIGLKKPDRKIFAEMLARLDVTAAAAVFVGDDFDSDVLGALDSGIDAVYLSQETDDVLTTIRRRYSGRVLCAELSHKSLWMVLKQFGFNLETN